MKMLKDDQQGFGLLEWLLLLLIILILIAAGWFVWDSKKKTEESQSNETQAQSDPSKSVKPKDETADWLLYSPPSKEYQVRIPDGWKLERYSDSSGIYSPNGASDIVYKQGTKATVTQVEGGRDFSAISFSLGYTKNSELQAAQGTKQTYTTKTKQGLEISKYKYEVTVEPDVMGPPKGTTEFFYRVTKGNYTIHVTHDIAPGEADQTQYIEKALATLEFL